MNKLKEIRAVHGMKQKELADYLGVAQSTLSGWEKNISKMNSKTMLKIANFFGVSVDYLLNNETNVSKEMKKYIVLPEKNVMEIPSAQVLPPSIAEQGNYMCLSVVGDSMEPDIKDGDIAIITLDEEYGSGDIIAIGVEGYCRAIRHVTETDDGIILKTLNPKYNLICYSNKQLNSRYVYVIGKLIEVRRSYL